MTQQAYDNLLPEDVQSPLTCKDCKHYREYSLVDIICNKYNYDVLPTYKACEKGFEMINGGWVRQ